MNNLIKTFKKDNDISFNKIKFSNSYIVQYDEFGKSIVDKIINSPIPNKKIIIGPLYNIEQDLEINKLTSSYPYIKKLVASKIAHINTVELDRNFDINNALICSSGVISTEQLIKNMNITSREDKCLVYFKKREKKDLDALLDFLKTKNQKYELFEYGKYNNRQLKESAKKCSFGIIMSRPETQGFGIQEIIACNLPVIVWDKTVNHYEHLKLSGTTVTSWDNNCGEIVYELHELKKIIDSFKNNLNLYNPGSHILNNLTFEKFNENLKGLFKSQI